MHPRHGELLSAAVLRPLTEQLVLAAPVRAGDAVCELMGDGGELTRRLQSAVGPAGTVVVSNSSDHILAADASMDVVASLINIVFANAPELLGDAVRVLRPGGVLAVVVWDAADPPPFEGALDAALREQGIESRVIRAVLSRVDPPRGSLVTTLRDVARFDGLAQLWTAMVEQRGVAAELVNRGESVLRAVRARYAESMERFAAPDGTMRIPFTARLIRRERSR